MARARYAVAAPSSSGCATTKRISALYRSSAAGRGLASCAALPSGRSNKDKKYIANGFIHPPKQDSLQIEKCRHIPKELRTRAAAWAKTAIRRLFQDLKW